MAAPHPARTPKSRPGPWTQASAPRLELDWEEQLFTRLRQLWLRWRPTDSTTGQRVSTTSLLPGLIMPVQVVAGWPCRVAVGRGTGGVQADGLLLPEHVPMAESPEQARDLLLTFALLGARMLALGPAPRKVSAGMRLLASLRSCALARHHLQAEWAGLRPILALAEARELSLRGALPEPQAAHEPWERARRMALEGGRPWLDPELTRRLETATRPTNDQPLGCWPEWLEGGPPATELGIPAEYQKPDASDGTEVEMTARADVEHVVLSKQELEDQVLQHCFEKVETADEYRGGSRQTDGEDELEDQLEALQEVDLRHLIRGGQAAHSVLRADLRLDPGIPDAADDEESGGLPYPEWDHRLRAYRPDWCRVHPALPAAQDAGWAASRLPELSPLIQRLRRLLERERERPVPIPRQEDGDELDTDAYSEDAGSLRGGHSAEGRWYVRDHSRRPDLALTLLLDVSLSSDSWVDNRRVLDLCKDAALVLGEVTRGLGEELEILAFSSRTRHHCRVWRVHQRGLDWTLGRARLGALQPEGYTRIGPALRFATDGLASQESRRRLLLLLTDGRPTDFDRYEGRHGMADVRQALREAQSCGVHVHALALDPRARAGLPAMFGEGRWHLLRHAEDLPELLTTIYGRLSQ